MTKASHRDANRKSIVNQKFEVHDTRWLKNCLGTAQGRLLLIGRFTVHNGGPSNLRGTSQIHLHSRGKVRRPVKIHDIGHDDYKTMLFHWLYGTEITEWTIVNYRYRDDMTLKWWWQTFHSAATVWHRGRQGDKIMFANLLRVQRRHGTDEDEMTKNSRRRRWWKLGEWRQNVMTERTLEE